LKRLLFVAVLLTACATSPVEDRQSCLSSTRATLDAFLSALTSGDAKIGELFTEDATVFFPMPNRPLRANGRAEISAAFASLFGPNYRGGVITPEALEIDCARDTAVVTFQIVNPNVTSRRTFVLRREAGRWRIVHLHGSNIRKE
jgi:ketosteroid isomerase-like protein